MPVIFPYPFILPPKKNSQPCNVRWLNYFIKIYFGFLGKNLQVLDVGVFIGSRLDWTGQDRRLDLRKETNWTRPVLNRKTWQEDRKLARSIRAIRHDHAPRTGKTRAAYAYGHDCAPSPAVAWSVRSVLGLGKKHSWTVRPVLGPVHQSNRSRSGPDLRPNSPPHWTNAWTEFDRSNPVQTDLRSIFGLDQELNTLSLMPANYS